MVMRPLDDARRLARRRSITLDLYTRHGDAWSAIDSVRQEWKIEPTVVVPPEPSTHASDFRLLTPLQMPERFHLPAIPPDKELEGVQRVMRQVLGEELPEEEVERMTSVHNRIHVAKCLTDLEHLHDGLVPEGNPSGTDRFGWMSWAPFLSACLLYDPPELELLAFADHDDQVAAHLPVQTYYQDARAAIQVERERAEAIGKAATLEKQLRAAATFIEPAAQTYKPSTPPAAPPHPRGRPQLDDLVSVQCAIFKRHGWTYPEIAVHYDWPLQADSYDTRRRANRAMDHVKRGEHILACQK